VHRVDYYAVADQPSGNIDPAEAWFYASICTIFVLVVVIVVLIVCLCRARRRSKVDQEPRSSVNGGQRTSIENENKYATVPGHSHSLEGATRSNPVYEKEQAIEGDGGYDDVFNKTPDEGASRYEQLEATSGSNFYQTIGNRDGVPTPPPRSAKPALINGWSNC
jgi:hypothetical protein